jgi:formiminoglutamate deiminase
VPLKRWHAELAWLGAPDAADTDVLIEVDGDRIAAVTAGIAPPPDATRLRGLTIPGLANVHSHAFHRALRGRTHGVAGDPGVAGRDAGHPAGSGDFWSWRERMYQVAERLDPDSYERLATAVYAEMALAGVSAVGEFHYLHHDRGGRRYADPNELGLACVRAARAAGLRITLLDTCYLRGGLDDRPLDEVQLRYGDTSAEAWAERVGRLRDGEGVRVGAAIHSVRAVDPAGMRVVAGWAAGRGAPLHLHLSEQPAENEACLAATGRTPSALVAEAGVLGPATTAVHATHLSADDVRLLGASGTGVCLCPTTERDLADGVGQARALTDAGSPLSLGSDSHAVIDLFEEARAVELDERLRSGRRGLHAPAALLAAATSAGNAALGWDAGRLAPGALADFATVTLDSPRLAGTTAAHAVAGVVFAATAADVTDLVVAGRQIVAAGRHLLIDNVPAALASAIRSVADPRR